MSRSVIERKNAQECYICNISGYLEEHHIFFGTAYRKKSEHYGLKVHLCYNHHRDPVSGVHFNKELDLMLKKRAQEVFEKSHSREEFMREFGKNYLD